MTNDRDLEHPDVSAIERTGYARGHEPKVYAFCSQCGEPIRVGDLFLRVWHFDCLCERCVDENWDEAEEDEDE